MAARKRNGEKRLVPAEKYLPWEGMMVITIDHLHCYHTKPQVKAFLKWMEHQTCGLMESGHLCYYVDDYERWLHGRPCID
jgi:hypothetical protein